MSTTTRTAQLRNLAHRLASVLNDCEDAGARVGWSPGEFSVNDQERRVAAELITWDEDKERWVE